MKPKLIYGLMVLLLGPVARSQTPAFYENWGVVQCPPEIPPTIDASNFVNHGQFIINFTNDVLVQLPVSTPPYETAGTLNYTNDFGAVMSCSSGFRLDYFSQQTSQRQRGASLYNAGTINCGTTGTANTLILGGILFNSVGSGYGINSFVNATNILNPGTINMGFDSLLTLQGDNIDLNNGNLAMEPSGFTFAIGGTNGSIVFNTGMFDGYWGLGDPITQSPLFYPNGIDPAIYFGTSPPITPFHNVTNRSYLVFEQELGGANFAPYLLDVTDSSGSNRTVRAVFLSNTNPAIAAKVYFNSFFGDPLNLGPEIVELSSIITNKQGVTTNFLYLEDTFLMFTNFQLLLDGNAGIGINRPTYIPENFNFFTGGQLFLGTPATPTSIPPGTFIPGLVTNQWTAYQALFQPGSVVLNEYAGQDVTNQPGRIQLSADKYLILTNAQISSVNYILLRATNQFGGSAGAQITAPYVDLFLGSTNGTLNLTNVVTPVLPRRNGICNLWSARWTNLTTVVTNTVTNRFHVLFVDAQFAPISTPTVQTLHLTATNALTRDDSITIRDVFNVSSNVFIDTRRLTLTTNAPGAPAAVGTLNLLSPLILWSSSTPRLQYLTNYGVIEAQNLIVFGGLQSSPYSSPAASTNPYVAFVNAGGITNFSSSIFANYFQNSGGVFANGGAIQLHQAQTAILTNGAFLAPSPPGAISIQGGSLFVSNHVLQAGSAITLSLANYLDDGSLSAGADAVSAKNTWYAGYGINLPVLPAQASLLATSITNTSPASTVVPNLWAGQDLGPVPAGFSNNAAIGRLILDGLANSSQFLFKGPGPSNALYVDYLEFREGMTNFDRGGNLANLQIAPGMKIYYAQLIINGVSFAEKLDQKNRGGLNWVPAYAGTFSSTNMVYPNGTTNRVNLALIQSADLDSNCNGIANASDPAPLLVSQVYDFAATVIQRTNVVLFWDGVALRTNYVEFKPSLVATNWQPLTNIFVSGTQCTPLQASDLVTNGTMQRFYRVRVDANVP